MKDRTDAELLERALRGDDAAAQDLARRIKRRALARKGAEAYGTGAGVAQDGPQGGEPTAGPGVAAEVVAGVRRAFARAAALGGEAPRCTFCLGDADGIDGVFVVQGLSEARVPSCGRCAADRSRLGSADFAEALRRRGVDVDAVGPRLEAAVQRRAAAN